MSGVQQDFVGRRHYGIAAYYAAKLCCGSSASCRWKENLPELRTAAIKSQRKEIASERSDVSGSGISCRHLDLRTMPQLFRGTKYRNEISQRNLRSLTAWNAVLRSPLQRHGMPCYEVRRHRMPSYEVRWQPCCHRLFRRQQSFRSAMFWPREHRSVTLGAGLCSGFYKL